MAKRKQSNVGVSIGSIRDSGYLPSGRIEKGDSSNVLYQEKVREIFGSTPKTISALLEDPDFNSRNKDFSTLISNEKQRQQETGLKDIKLVQDEEPDLKIYSEFRQVVPLSFESENLADIFESEKMGINDASLSRGVRLTHHRFTSFMEPVQHPLWKTFSISGSLDERSLDDILTALIYYPKVVNELISWMRSADTELSVINPFLESRVRWGRDTYREGNFKFSTSELLSSLQKMYSSWGKSEGKQLLIILLMELIRGDIKGSGWLKEDCDYTLPIRLPLRPWSLPAFENVRATAIKKLLLKYFSLANMFDEKSISGGASVFAEGKAMLQTDLAMAIRVKKRAMSALVYSLERLEASWAVTRALALIKVYDLKPVNYDAYESVMESADLARLVEDFSFVYPVLNDDYAFEYAANLTITSEEAAKHVARVAEHWFDMPEFSTTPISDIKDRVAFFKTYGPESKRCGAALLTSLSCVGNSVLVASSHNASVLGSGFANYETHNYSATTTLYNELSQALNDLGSTIKVQNFLKDAKVEQYPLVGLFTNLGVYERFLVYLALNNGVLTLDHEVDIDNPSKLAVSSIAGIIACPTPVFPLELGLEVANVWFPNRIADETYYLKDLTQWFLGCEVVDQPWKKAWTELEIKLPTPVLTQETTRTLDTIARTKAGFVLDLSFDHPDFKGPFTARLQSDFVIGEEVLRDALLHIDATSYLTNNYNLQLAIGLREICARSEALTLGLNPDDERITYSVDIELLDHFTKVFGKSAIFTKLLNRAVHALLVAIAGEKKFDAKAFQASYRRELENTVGLRIAEYLNLLLGITSPELFSRFKLAAERQLERRFFYLWR